MSVIEKVGLGREMKFRVSGIIGYFRVFSGKYSILPLFYKFLMGHVWKKSGSGGFGYTRILEFRVRVLKKGGFGRVILGSGIPGLITCVCYHGNISVQYLY